MSLLVKLLISLAVAAAATAATTQLAAGEPGVLQLFAAFCCATIATALLVSLPGRSAATAGPTPAPGSRPAGSAADSGTGAERESGKVKWFNMSKGFGFIIRDNGEEIFVHFRSIRGEGRRGLRDGQRVSFVVVDSEKGPQAEDVEGID